MRVQIQRPLALVARKDDNGTPFLFTGSSELPPREVAEQFLLAAQNTLRLSDEAVAAHNAEMIALERAEEAKAHALADAPMPPRPAKRTTLYLMRNARNGYTKIGVSKNPKKRERTLQSEEPEIDLIYSVETWDHVEELLHEVFRAFRVRGEWFNLSQEHIKSIPDRVKALEISL